MEVLIKGLPSGYEVEHVARVFFPALGVRCGPSTKGPLVYARAGRHHLAAALRMDGKCHVRRVPVEEGGPDTKTRLSRLVYDLLCEATGQRPAWGLLTGVRPVRFWRKSLHRLGSAGAEALFTGLYGVSPQKVALIRGIEARQAPFLQDVTPRDYSLYVSIPFCPTRCSYCSFVSQTIQQEDHFIGPYLEKMKEELAETARVARGCGLRLRSVYIGGGTPTALSLPQLERLLEDIAASFDIGAAKEYTVEAGRPDCTDVEKLRLLHQKGVTRLSINPQSMSQRVLDAIGRRHGPEDILRCYEDARRAGHNNINMDLIAGLPADTPQSFEATLSAVLALAPENLTLHTLTLKRGSFLREEGSDAAPSPGALLESAYPRFEEAGYLPYYLYRQKSTLENLENTGWAKPGYEGLYNIYIMEEVHSILAVGAGASTKLVAGGGDIIQRRYNPKYPADYIQNIAAVLEKKRGVKTFYAGIMDPQETG